MLILSGIDAWSVKNIFPESPDITSSKIGQIFPGLFVGLDRDASILGLEKAGFLGYKELQSNLIKAPVRWDGHSYELSCKFNEMGKLELCLLQGESGWQDFFYEDIVRPQWLALYKRMERAYGKPVQHRDFPEFHEVPLNDKGGLITSQWELSDRTILLGLQSYIEQDCCTKQMLDFSCCILLIQPK